MEEHNHLTLEEIEASWLGHGRKIPIGEMMAWLIKELNDLQYAVAETASECHVPHDCDFTSNETLKRIEDFFKEHKAQVTLLEDQKRELRDVLGAAETHLTALAIMARENTLYKWNSAGTVQTIHEIRALLYGKDAKKEPEI